MNGNIKNILIVVGIVVVVAVIGFSYLKHKEKVADLKKRGVVAEAEIMDLKKDVRTRRKKGRTRRTYKYYITVKYTAEKEDGGDGRTYTKRVSTNQSRYNNNRIGDYVDIVYLPEKPDDFLFKDEVD
ncbi:MAG: DUF3592 domain-containing protein [bacterium]|nr:DUF3592 domain-containing protein [bacterium]